MIRFLAIGMLVVLFPFIPGDAKTIQQTCKDRCGTEYNFCLKRSLTNKARKDCKTQRSTCKHGCGK